jgi:glucokinase
MLLAGDIGGTKTLLGLFDPLPARPRPVATASFGTLAFPDLPTMIAGFLDAHRVAGRTVEAACFGVAGPVLGEAAELTNVPWRVDARHVSTVFDIRRVALLNDLEALGHAVPVLTEAEVHVLQAGEALRGGNMALIAAGTGLGEALLHNVGGRFLPSASEGGHADFAARTERDIAVLRALTARFGRVDVERVVSGHGLLNLHPVLHKDRCAAGVDLEAPDAAARISAAAVARTCAGCIETLDEFIEAYGAEAGNLALRAKATGGVYVGGGIAPKILAALEAGPFMRAFRAKPPLDELVAGVPVKVILNPDAGLLGAAVFAGQLNG